MSTMTKEDLTKFIKEATVPMVKEVVGAQVAEVVEAAVARAMEAATKQARSAGFAQAMFGDGAPAASGQVKLAPGMLFARYARALAAARGDREKAAKTAAHWGYREVAESINKAMAAGDPVAGGFLVPPEFSSDVIELLRASAVVRSLDPLTMPMANGSVKVPRITQGVTAGYVGENITIPKSEMKTGQLTLTFKKLAALVPISNDLIRYSTPQADQVVRDDAVRALATREDRAFIRDNGTDGTPQGLKNLIHPDNKFAANGTVNLANVTADLGEAMQKIMDAEITLIIQQGGTPGIDARPGWLFSPRQWKYLTTVLTANGVYAFRDEMLRGTLWGFPYRVTTQVENDTVYFGCFAHAVIGEATGLIIDASGEAAYNDGNGLVAAFSQDQTVIRVIAEHDFNLRHDKAFSLITGVTWGA